MANKLNPIGKSSLGIEENLAALLCYIAMPITAIVFLITEKTSKFVKFHAIQAIGVVVVIFILNIIRGVLSYAYNWIFEGVFIIGFFSWVLMSLFNLIVYLGGLAAWAFLMYKSYQGEWFELPIIGKIALEQSNK